MSKTGDVAIVPDVDQVEGLCRLYGQERSGFLESLEMPDEIIKI
jgi:hypothetical protein